MFISDQKDTVLRGVGSNTMNKFGIVFDSTVYINKKILEENNVKVASLNVVAGTESYRELDIDNKFVFDMQDKGASFTTSQPAPGEFLNAYEELINQGIKKIFVVTLSKNISGTYQSALIAKNMLEEPNNVHVFDTMLAAFGTEMIGIELIDMINSGKTEEEIVTRITKIIGTSGQMFTVENLFSLAKGGRLTATQAMIGTVLRVKPIIKVVDGKLKLDKKERSYKKVHNYFLETIKKESNGYENITFYITETSSPESGLVLKGEIEEHFPKAKITFTDYLGPVFSIHVGKKGYGLSWFAE